MWQYLNQHQPETCPYENDQILLATIRTTIKDELSAHKVAIKEITNSNMKSRNERLGKLFAEMANLNKCLEHTQEQLDDKLKIVKIDIKNLDTAV